MLITDWLPEHDISSLTWSKVTHRRKNEGDGYDFAPGELRLAKAMGTAVANMADVALKEFDEITGLTKKQRRTNLARELEKLDPIMRQAWNSDTEKLVASIIGDLSVTGANRTDFASRFADLPTRSIIEEGMVASAKYYTNNYFNRVVLPTMIGDINRKIESGEVFDDTYYRSLREKMNTRLKSVPYWKTVGNQAASRAYHYGLVRAGKEAGHTGIVFRAIVDERTTDVCLDMNGRVFWLEDALIKVEQIARTDPATLPEAHPFPTLEQIEGQDSNELAKLGVITPPLHYNCRSTLALSR